MLEEFSFVRYFKITLLIDNVDRVWKQFCVRWTAGDKANYCIKQSVLGAGSIEAVERYVMATFIPLLSGLYGLK